MSIWGVSTVPDGNISQKVVGVKQTLKALKNYKCKIVYVAKEADKNLVKPIIELAELNSIPILYINTMKELGELCGIDVGAAVALDL
jgi:large subunit ribosomal protein L7A